MTTRASEPAVPGVLEHTTGVEPVRDVPDAIGAIDLERIEAYDFVLPPALIADQPSERREGSRLLEVDGPQLTHHERFASISERLRPGDLLIVNDVRVQPMRLHARRASGGRVELLVLNEAWHPTAEGLVVPCFVRARRGLGVSEEVTLEGPSGAAVSAWIGERAEDGTTRVRFAVRSAEALDEVFAVSGQLPLPPYIVKRRRAAGVAEYTEADAARYQTVYASRGRAIAAPTAGLHFSASLLAELEARGVERAAVTLEVGAGTFQPVRCSALGEHAMHVERYTVERELVDAVVRTRALGGRVIAVGTTVVRALEDQMMRFGGLRPGRYETRIFIRPGHRFGSIDGLITNFHLPRSTLLVLVCALGGYREVMGAYAEAVAHGYRFFSYGDSMLLWPTRSAR